MRQILYIRRVQNNLDAGTNCIAIGGDAVANELEAEEMTAVGNLITQKAKSWSIPIGCPNIEVAILIPIGSYKATAIIGKIKNKKDSSEKI